MKQSGYYRFPTIAGDKIVFVCEDDLWSVSSEGGTAVRLTSNLGEVTKPQLSHDGKWIAFTGKEEGHTEVYVMSAQGGPEKRITYLGSATAVIGWTPDNKHILFVSNAGQPFQRMSKIFKVSPEGGLPEMLPVGIAHNISFGESGGIVLGLHTSDPARWKRYRGGTAGVIWIDTKGNGEFRKLIDINGNLGSPMWIKNRIYFISDHENVGNLYSCTPEGNDLIRHTSNKEYFVRNASTDGKRIVYHAGGEIFTFDPDSDKNSEVNIEFHSSQVQRNRKFVNSARYLEDYNLHPEGHSLVITSRGKPFYFPNWEGSVIQLGEPDGVRNRLTQWLNNKKEQFVTISDKGGKEAIEVHTPGFNKKVKRLDGLDIGRAVDMEASPVEDKIVLSNHRAELILVDISKKTAKVLDRSKFHHQISGFCWSPDGKWVAYGCSETQNTTSIKICNIKTGDVHLLTEPRFRDAKPSFDPDGKFIYFLSHREFNPVYDSIYFDLGFPKGMLPMLISLKKDTLSPFASIPKFMKDEKDKKEGDEKDKDKKLEEGKDRDKLKEKDVKDDKKAKNSEKEKEEKKIPDIEIDFEGIENRVLAFPVPEAKYHQIWGLKGKVLFTSSPVKGSLNTNWFSEEPEGGITLEYYDFEQQKTEVVATNISFFKVSLKNEVLIYRTGLRLRVTSIAPLDKNKPADDKPGKKSGWIALDRVKVSVIPLEEWKQMYSEIWHLQKDHFWDADMCGLDWNKVHKRYFKLINKVSTRSEFSDLIWEMQGELGTSHAYEIGGDYRLPPVYSQGFLCSDYEYDLKSGAYKIKHIVRGDSWKEKQDSPLNRIGVNVREGDILVAINNQKLDKEYYPQKLLTHKANTEVLLTFAGKKKNDYREVLVKTLSGETNSRYREWVEFNRKKVHKASGGRVGYIHIPDMGPEGYSEFHRYYFVEVEKESVIIDVRFNGGGHVSQLLLEKLARKRIAYNVNRWGAPESYPSDSLLGPVIAITNEYAGSDGDIFSHSYKMMNLGKLIGKRTWGGVVGIWPRHKLVDGSITTQPEFSFWFADVGWGVENYGTDPDIEIEYRPQDWANNTDPQLDKALELILEEIDKNPPKLPDFGHRPILVLPE